MTVKLWNCFSSSSYLNPISIEISIQMSISRGNSIVEIQRVIQGKFWISIFFIPQSINSFHMFAIKWWKSFFRGKKYLKAWRKRMKMEPWDVFFIEFMILITYSNISLYNLLCFSLSSPFLPGTENVLSVLFSISKSRT